MVWSRSGSSRLERGWVKCRSVGNSGNVCVQSISGRTKGSVRRLEMGITVYIRPKGSCFVRGTERVDPRTRLSFLLALGI